MGIRLCALVVAGLMGLATAASALEVAVRPGQPSPGEVFVVELAEVPDEALPELRVGDQQFRMWTTGPGAWAGFVAVDRDQEGTELPVRILDTAPGAGAPVLHSLVVPLQTRTYPEQHLRVSDRMVHLSPEDQERAARENRLIRKTLGKRTPEREWATPFTVPTQGPVTSPFGVRRVYNGVPRSYHSGVDIGVPQGAPIAATSEGRVALVGDYFYTGNTVFIDHGLGLYSAYFHLEETAVEEGQRVAAGDPIGSAGSTGRSTGPHLHWGVYLSGVKVDPFSLLQLAGSAAGGGESP